jgi:hypothetical protein
MKKNGKYFQPAKAIPSKINEIQYSLKQYQHRKSLHSVKLFKNLNLIMYEKLKYHTSFAKQITAKLSLPE